MFIVGISNSLAVEIWNSYNMAYLRPLYIQADCKMTVQVTNDAGFAPAPFTFNLGGAFFGATNLPASSLQNTGLNPPLTSASKQPKVQSFAVPLQTNVVVLQDSVQIGNQMYVADSTSAAQWNNLPWDNLSDPHWWLNITNRLRCIVMDGGSGGRVVDYVQLNRLDATRYLTQEAINGANNLGVWTSNLVTGVYWATPTAPMSQGAVQQIQISIGAVPTSSADWANNGLPTGNKAASIAAFQGFMTSSTISSNIMQSPFTPTAKIYQLTKWQANDPLVHYLPEDLNYSGSTITGLIQPPANGIFLQVTSSLYRLNDRYSPWGGNGPRTGWIDFNYDPHLFDTALKDPLVMTSDNWNFPSNQPLNFSWLGQVHRGTPWQTVYLKSADILGTDPTAWQKWSGSANLVLASNSAPVIDRLLLGVLNSLMTTNDPRQLLSVNNPDTNAWLHMLDGFTVLTNSPGQLTLSPVIVSSNSPQAAVIANGISQNRDAQPGRLFKNISDVLGTPELSDTSPFLDTNHLAQIDAGALTDEALEKIPSQLLPLLRLDSIGSMISANGQQLVQFTGDDNYSYAVEASSNLVNWVRVSTNLPINGVFSPSIGTAPGAPQQFYRSILLP